MEWESRVWWDEEGELLMGCLRVTKSIWVLRDGALGEVAEVSGKSCDAG